MQLLTHNTSHPLSFHCLLYFERLNLNIGCDWTIYLSPLYVTDKYDRGNWNSILYLQCCMHAYILAIERDIFSLVSYPDSMFHSRGWITAPFLHVTVPLQWNIRSGYETMENCVGPGCLCAAGLKKLLFCQTRTLVLVSFSRKWRPSLHLGPRTQFRQAWAILLRIIEKLLTPRVRVLDEKQITCRC